MKIVYESKKILNSFAVGTAGRVGYGFVNESIRHSMVESLEVWAFNGRGLKALSWKTLFRAVFG
jgi:hypothetical protein